MATKMDSNLYRSLLLTENDTDGMYRPLKTFWLDAEIQTEINMNTIWTMKRKQNCCNCCIGVAGETYLKTWNINLNYLHFLILLRGSK